MKFRILGLLAIAAGIIAFTMAGHSQKSLPLKEKFRRERQLPVVDFSEKRSTDANALSKRKAIANRYDRSSSQVIEEAYNIDGRIFGSDWSRDLSALPFPQSDVVLIGGVMDAKAHLSNDKTGIYSEFAVQVEQVFKNSTSDVLKVGNAVVLERFGGAVRFSSGVLLKYETQGQGMPAVGQRCLFFLQRLDETNYRLITGYHLDGQVVSPLDGAVVEGGKGAYPFDTYQGFDVSTFLLVLKNEASQTTKL